MCGFRLAAALVLAAALPCGVVQAQIDPSPVVAGEPVRGTLRAIQPRRADQTLYHIHLYAATEGERVVITLLSDDFDAYLLLGDAVETIDDEGAVFGPRRDIDGALATDDDGGGGRNARLEFTFPHTGIYYIVVNAFAKDEAGDYVLRVESSRAPTSDRPDGTTAPATPVPATQAPAAPATPIPAALPDGLVSVRRGEAVRRNIEFYESPRITSGFREGRRYQDVWYWAQAGEETDVRAKSKHFGLYLYVAGPVRGTPGPDVDLPLVRERDSTNDRQDNVAAFVTFPETGWYRIRVLSLNSTSGWFGLAVTPRGQTLPDQAFGPEFAPPAPAPTPVPSFTPPAPSRPATLDELVEESLRWNEAQGNSLAIHEDYMALRGNSFFVDVGPPVRPGTFRFTVLEAGGLSPADVKVHFRERRLGQWTEAGTIGLEYVSQDLPGGILRTGARFSVDEEMPSDEYITFEVIAGAGPGASARRVVVLVFLE